MLGHKKLGRNTAHRMSMIRNLTTEVLKHGRIETTLTRAKETKRMVDKMITLGKKGDLAAKRKAFSFLFDEATVIKLFVELAPKYQDRNGGYTRILKLGPRRGDVAEAVFLELV